MTSVNITTSSTTININNNPDKTINPNTELLNNNQPNVSISTKVCKTCRTIKYITDFYKDKSRYNGYAYICKINSKNQKTNMLNEIKKK